MELLNEFEKDNKISNNSSSIRLKKYLVLLIAIIIILIVIIIFLAIFKRKKTVEEITQTEKVIEIVKVKIDWNIYGTILYNLSYAHNGKIINTFKENGENYNESIGNINEGNDYDKSKRNIYNLFIPHSALKNNDKNNGIILFIHGGNWDHGEKEYFNKFCKIYTQMGYITATMGYTLLKKDYKNYNIFRILDEITACIQSIKEQLEKKGFQKEKLSIAIGGYSAGGHLTLLYTYLMTNSPIKVKFAINICGLGSLEPKYFYKLAKFNDTLDDLYLPAIEEAIESKKIVKIMEDESGPLLYMNNFVGNKYSEEDLKEMVFENNNTINENNPKYIELFNIVSNAFPFNIEDKNKVPTICVLGGNDDEVGVAQFAYLNQKAEKDGKELIYVYSRYAGHDYLNFETDDGILAMREMNYQINNLSKLYFS